MPAHLFGGVITHCANSQDFFAKRPKSFQAVTYSLSSNLVVFELSLVTISSMAEFEGVHTIIRRSASQSILMIPWIV